MLFVFTVHYCILLSLVLLLLALLLALHPGISFSIIDLKPENVKSFFTGYSLPKRGIDCPGRVKL